MHARRRGKSGSTKPISKNPPQWMNLKKSEIEAIIVKLAKKGYSSSKIGLVLRDSYGVPDVKSIIGKKVCQILKNRGLSSDIPEDLQNLIVRAVRVRKHLDKNKKDRVSERGLNLINSKIRRLVKYYKKEGVLSKDWKYNLKRARLLVG